MAVGFSGFVRVLQVGLSLNIVARTHTTKSYVWFWSIPTLSFPVLIFPARRQTWLDQKQSLDGEGVVSLAHRDQWGITDLEMRVQVVGTPSSLPMLPEYLLLVIIINFYRNYHTICQHAYLSVCPPALHSLGLWICDMVQSFLIFVFVPALRVHDVKCMCAWMNPRGTEWIGTQMHGQMWGHRTHPGAFDITKPGKYGRFFPVAPPLSMTADHKVGQVVVPFNKNSEGWQQSQCL